MRRDLECHLLREPRLFRAAAMTYDASGMPHGLNWTVGAHQSRSVGHLSLHRRQDTRFAEVPLIHEVESGNIYTFRRVVVSMSKTFFFPDS
jgi:hypothetical protein